MKAKLLAGVVGAGALLVGCGPKVAVEADVNGTNGADITEAFFGTAALENQPLLISEDFDGDGNIDVNEDLDGDFVLDVDEDLNDNGVLDADEVDVDGDGVADPANEDIDGDGNLDFVDEDQNDNGVLDETPIDLNGDGVVDDNDVATQSVFFLVGSTGAINCENFTEALESNQLNVDDTILFLSGFQSTVGADVDSVFAEGNTVVNDAENEIELRLIFGKVVDGEFDETISAFGDDDVTFTIEALDDVLTAQLDAVIFDGDGSEFNLAAQFTRIEECQGVSDFIAAQLAENGF